MRSDHAIILAAGRATRLGGVVAGGLKTHVSVEGRPAFAHQVEVLRTAGINSLTVVVAPDGANAIAELLDHVAVPFCVDCNIVVQHDATGPGDALAVGVAESPVRATVLLLADTIVSALPKAATSWIAVAEAPSSRRWCVVTEDDTGEVRALDDRFVDVDALTKERVAVGLYRFADPEELRAALEGRRPRAGAESEISEILLRYSRRVGLQVVSADSWYDAGDVTSAQRARLKIRSRSCTSLTVDTTSSTVVKRGSNYDFTFEARYLQSLPKDLRPLFPAIYDVAEDLSEYVSEFVDLPTLAELFLYSPSHKRIWTEIIERLIQAFDTRLWLPQHPPGDAAEATHAVLVDKLRERWTVARADDALFRSPFVDINGERYAGGDSTVQWLIDELTQVARTPEWRVIHGDLHFSNILYGPGSGAFRLLDPRGAFPAATHSGDLRYDLAKLRHSYSGSFDAIDHNLFEITGRSNTLEFRVVEPDPTLVTAFDSAVVIPRANLRDIKLIEASLFLSMLPLHRDDGARRRALFARGITLADALMREKSGDEVPAGRSGEREP